MTFDAGVRTRPSSSPSLEFNEQVAVYDLLRRVCATDRLSRFMAQASADQCSSIRISALDGTLLAAQSLPAHNVDLDTIQASMPILYAHRQVATVQLTGTGACLQVFARLAALWIEDVLRLEYELGSLTHEVVHAYEELHVLYELGAQLSGVLEVEAVCNVVARAVVAPLTATRVRLALMQAGIEQVVADITSSAGELVEPARAQAQAAAAIRINGEQVGRLIVEGKQTHTEFSSDDLKLLEGIASVASPAIQAAQLYEAARQRADTDGLTGICNHRRLQERVDEEIERARRYGHPLTIILADLDNFKLFNDVYGHPVGDRVLQTVTESLRASTRAYDIIGRYGGDEFMIILPETNAVGATEVAERILADIAAREIIVDGERLPLGMSLGLAAFPGDATTKHELIAHADSALYESKRSGGRAVRMARGPRSDWLAMQSSSFGVLEGLVQSVDAKDHYTREHSDVVTEVAVMLAQQLNLSEETRRALRIAGLLHDVGKIGIPDHVLKKPGRLSGEEYEIMKQHVQLSEMMIKNVPYLNDVLDAVAHHHERFDGTGYPYGKAAHDIPLLGRIMAIADAYSAMCLDRPYRKGLTWSEARQELERGAGTQFDPHLVNIFIKRMDAEHAPAIDQPLAEAA